MTPLALWALAAGVAGLAAALALAATGRRPQAVPVPVRPVNRGGATR